LLKAIELPEKSTLLDFAYHIHQEIGDKAVGGRVNGVFSALHKELKSGDIVEINVNKMQRPRRGWLKFVVSGRARSKIKQGVRKYENIPVPKKIFVAKKREEELDNVVFSNEFPHAKLVLAKCCSPIPEEEIVAVMRTPRLFSVHSKNCSEVEKLKRKLIPVHWKESFNRPLKIKAHARERAGILADILNTITSGGFVVKEAKIKMLESGMVECGFVVVPKELSEVVRMIDRIKKVRGVKKVFFG